MNNEIDRRAALAMGWTWGLVGYDSCWNKDGNFKRLGSSWSPSTDRNDLVELLREVERRGQAHLFIDKMLSAWLRCDDHDGIDMMTFWHMTADPAIICAAACEALEYSHE